MAGENLPGIPSACATRNFTYLVRGLLGSRDHQHHSNSKKGDSDHQPLSNKAFSIAVTWFLYIHRRKITWWLPIALWLFHVFEAQTSTTIVMPCFGWCTSAGCQRNVQIFEMLWIFGDLSHDDRVTWRNFPRYWPFVRESIGNREFPHKRLVILVFFDVNLKNGWINRRVAGDLVRHDAHCDVIVIQVPLQAVLCWRRCVITRQPKMPSAAHQVVSFTSSSSRRRLVASCGLNWLSPPPSVVRTNS